MKLSNFSQILCPAGVIVILLTILIFSIADSSFSHISQTVSELNSRNAIFRLPVNIGYTLGFVLLSISAAPYLKSKQGYIKTSGYLMLISFLLILMLTWVFPMDDWQGYRTPADQVHNNIISGAVALFLISQLFIMRYLIDPERKKASIYFAVALLFSVLSMYANITQSELINISERGWMLTFLIYLIILPDLINSSRSHLKKQRLVQTHDSNAR